VIELLVRHLAVIGTAWLLSLALRNRSAALRHALWTLALVACVLLPVLQQVPLVLPAQLTSPMGADWPGAAAIAGELNITRTASVAQLPRTGFHWATLAWCVYIATAFTLALRWFIGLRQAVQLARRGQSAGSVRGIPVIAVDGVGPLAFGWPRGVIIVPHADLAHNEMVMRHELAHIQRADFLWQAVGTLACALWWFSPAVWLALRALRREAEQACDDRVLATGTSAADYADGLLEVAAM
jgi:beta-lactamase regulating signal transducer with metallopeptidase domain